VKVAQKSIFRELIVTVLVTPGRHSVTFGFYDTFSNSITPATLVFDAAAGATYELHAADAPVSFGQGVGPRRGGGASTPAMSDPRAAY